MRITRFIGNDGQTHFGIDRGDGSAERLDWTPFKGEPSPTGQVVPITRRLTPLDPPVIFCIGLNYRAHAEETGAAIPEQPVIFMKPPTAAIAAGENIRIPACCTRGPEVDYEAELAVVIGKTARDVSEANALDHVLGYTCANDVSARRWQKHAGGGQWIRGKGFDTFCPLGPVLVTRGTPGNPANGPDTIADPQRLRLSTTVNGNVMQDGHTSDMIFPVAKLIAFLSQDTTLLPGTVILTGTPPGVGVARKPQVFLQPGDEVTIEIEGIGKLTNPVV